MPEQFDLVDVIDLAMRAERDDIHTAMPGRVVKYYPATQTADVQPMLKRPVFDDDDNRLEGASIPTLPGVPVVWPRAGGFIMTMPMEPGDFVWVMFSEGGTGEFRQTGQESEPFDVARHQITYPYCIPGAFPDVLASGDADVAGNDVAVIGFSGGIAKMTLREYDGHTANRPTQITIGQGNAKIQATEIDPLGVDPWTIKLGDGATDAVALASKVDAVLTAIAGWTPVAGDGGAALKLALTAFLSAYTTGSVHVKAK